MFGKLSLIKKIIAMIVINALIMLIVGFFIYGYLDTVDNIWNRYKNEDVKRQSYLLDIKSMFGFGGMIHGFKNYLLRGDQKYLDRFEQNRAGIKKTIQLFKTLKTTDIEKKALADIEAVVEAYASNIPTIKKMLAEGKTIKEIDTIVKVDDKPALKAFEEIKKHFIQLEQEESTKMSGTLTRSKIFMTVGLLLVIIIITLFSIITITRNVLRPIAELVKVSDSVSNFDLTEQVNVKTDDEIGKLGASFNAMITHLREIIQKVNDSTGTIGISSDEISSSSDDLASQTSEQAASITQTSTTLNELTTTVQQNSDNSEDASNALLEFNQEIQSRTELMNNVTATMEEIHDAGKKIDNIVSVINDISFQTNLLALNAAVEAARAGEAGRGFAVVASEVRNLAQKTAESSKTIQEIVSHNVQSTQRGMELVNQTTDFFSTIVNVMQDIVDKISQISSGSREQSTGIDQLNTAVDQLEVVINRNASLAEELSATVKSLRSDSLDLQNLVGRFKYDNTAPATKPIQRTTAPSPKPITEKPNPTDSTTPIKESTGKKQEQKRDQPEDDFFGMDDDGFEEF